MSFNRVGIGLGVDDFCSSPKSGTEDLIEATGPAWLAIGIVDAECCELTNCC